MVGRFVAEVLAEAAAEPQSQSLASDLLTESASSAEARSAGAAVVAEVAASASAMMFAAAVLAESAAETDASASASAVLAEAASKPIAAASAAAVLVEVLRRESAHDALVVEAQDAFGQAPWDGANVGVFAFRHDWSDPFIERLQWQTVISRSASGVERRRAMRSLPRRSCEWLVGHGRDVDAMVADWMHANAGRNALWPLPQHSCTLTHDAPAGHYDWLHVDASDTSAFGWPAGIPYVDPLGLSGWEGQAFALMLSADGWQLLRTSATNSFSIGLVEPLARPARAGSLLMPLVLGVAVDPASATQWIPGASAVRVAAQVQMPAPPDGVDPGDAMLDGAPVWPDGSWGNDPAATAQGVVSQLDLSQAEPWTRRSDPWAAGTLQRTYFARGRDEIAAWTARLWRMRGRLGECWVADGTAPVLTVQAAAGADDGYLRVDRPQAAAFWHGQHGAMVLMPDGRRQHALVTAMQADWHQAALVLGSGLDEAVPAGSRVIRLARCRLDHDLVE
ncbi:MAG: hypothetical protein ACK4J1_01220, partial [Hylemonella sp.]